MKIRCFIAALSAIICISLVACDGTAGGGGQDGGGQSSAIHNGQASSVDTSLLDSCGIQDITLDSSTEKSEAVDSSTVDSEAVDSSTEDTETVGSSTEDTETVDSSTEDVEDVLKPEENASQGLEYKLSKDGTYYTVTGRGYCRDEHIIIPSVYNGKPVTDIGDGAFMYRQGIKSVVLPKTITRIGNGAFQNCYDLLEVYIPKGVTFMGSLVFMQSHSVKIYCEEKSQPECWDFQWNYMNYPVVWGYEPQK